ncbi:SLC13 family permease [Vibrio rhizosphaerae]|uniref:SLC13 family permease n=1 Tax=Vibrio rhizosphaerae TaxID=398736 RepID=UPI00056E57E7|nr:SLC13 family permease [Vibrio rhizosphaerae]
MLLINSSTIVLIAFFLTILGLIRYQLYPERVFGALLLFLYTSNLVSSEQVIASFANPGLLTLILLILCSLALEKTKILRVIANYVIKPGYYVTWFRLYVVTTISSAFLNNTAVVSTMLSPIRNNPHHMASKLLIPLSYSAILGGTLTLIGTSTNLIVNSMVIDQGLPGLGFFDFTLVSSVLVLSCGFTLLLCSRWLPEKAAYHTIASDYFIDISVHPDSHLIGKSIEKNGLRNLESLFLVEILRRNRLISPVAPHEIIESGDRLIFSGDIKKVTQLTQFDGLSSFADQNGLPLDNLTEVIIRPDSILVGQNLKEVGFRALFDAAVVGIRRDGEKLSGKLGDVSLHSGDYLILAIGDDFKSRRNISKNFYQVSGVTTEQYLHGKQEKLTIIGFITAITLAAIGIVSLFKSLLIFLSLLLFCGCLNPNEIIQRFPKNIWLIIATAILLSQTISQSADFLELGLWVQKHHSIFTPFIGLLLIYGITWILTELITNNAAAALSFPIAYGLATNMGVDPKAYILAVAFGASASFISPYSYQTNLMVYSAGQYRLVDFVRMGLPVSLMYGVVVIGCITIFYL